MKEKQKMLLKKIVEKDIFYAYSIYDFGTVKNSSLKQVLVRHLLMRLNNSKITSRKKARLGWLISNILSDEKYIPKIIEYIEDDEIGAEVAVSIAKVNHTRKRSIPKS